MEPAQLRLAAFGLLVGAAVLMFGCLTGKAPADHWQTTAAYVAVVSAFYELVCLVTSGLSISRKAQSMIDLSELVRNIDVLCLVLCLAAGVKAALVKAPGGTGTGAILLASSSSLLFAVSVCHVLATKAGHKAKSLSAEDRPRMIVFVLRCLAMTLLFGVMAVCLRFDSSWQASWRPRAMLVSAGFAAAYHAINVTLFLVAFVNDTTGDVHEAIWKADFGVSLIVLAASIGSLTTKELLMAIVACVGSLASLAAAVLHRRFAGPVGSEPRDKRERVTSDSTNRLRLVMLVVRIVNIGMLAAGVSLINIHKSADDTKEKAAAGVCTGDGCALWTVLQQPKMTGLVAVAGAAGVMECAHVMTALLSVWQSAQWDVWGFWFLADLAKFLATLCGGSIALAELNGTAFAFAGLGLVKTGAILVLCSFVVTLIAALLFVLIYSDLSGHAPVESVRELVMPWLGSQLSTKTTNGEGRLSTLRAMMLIVRILAVLVVAYGAFHLPADPSSQAMAVQSIRVPIKGLDPAPLFETNAHTIKLCRLVGLVCAGLMGLETLVATLSYYMQRKWDMNYVIMFLDFALCWTVLVPACLVVNRVAPMRRPATAGAHWDKSFQYAFEGATAMAYGACLSLGLFCLQWVVRQASEGYSVFASTSQRDTKIASPSSSRITIFVLRLLDLYCLVVAAFLYLSDWHGPGSPGLGMHDWEAPVTRAFWALVGRVFFHLVFGLIFIHSWRAGSRNDVSLLIVVLDGLMLLARFAFVVPAYISANRTRNACETGAGTALLHDCGSAAAVAWVVYVVRASQAVLAAAVLAFAQLVLLLRFVFSGEVKKSLGIPLLSDVSLQRNPTYKI